MWSKSCVTASALRDDGISLPGFVVNEYQEENSDGGKVQYFFPAVRVL